MARKATDVINIRVRMPEGLRKRLAGEAERAQRSLNSEIVWRLGQSLGPEGAEFIKEHEAFDQKLERAIEEALAKIVARKGHA
jgi:Arc-like DNA binding domain